MIFSETEGLTLAEKLSIAKELRRGIDLVEAASHLELGKTQVVLDGEMYEQSLREQVPLIDATHSLTIAYKEVAVAIRTAFLEYGSISETMDSAYVLRTAISRCAKRHKVGVSGFVRVSLVASESDRSHDRFEIAFHGSAALGEMSEHQFVEVLAQYLMISSDQVMLSPL